MANIKSQIKRNLTNEARRQRNQSVRSSLRTAIRHFREAVETGDKDKAAELARSRARSSTRPPARASSTPIRPPTRSRPSLWPSTSSDPQLTSNPVISTRSPGFWRALSYLRVRRSATVDTACSRA